MRNAVLVAKLLVVALPAASAASAAPIHRPSARPQLVRSALSLRGGAAVGGSPSPGGGGAQMVPPHASTAKDVLEQAGVVADAGLSDARAAELLKKFGRNELEADAGTPLWALFLAQFDDRLVQILLAVAALSYGLALLEGKPDDWVESAVILLILLLNAVVGTWQEASAAGALSALQSLQPETARCLRGGTWINELSAAELVPGDVIELRVGDSVPADARVVQMLSTGLSTDEGSLTGESATVQKQLAPVAADSRIQQKTCMVFASTVVSSGRALAVVTATGGRTEIGKIQAGVVAAKAEEEKTPLAQKLDAFGNRLTVAIGAICVAVWLINVPRFSDPAFGGTWRGALYYLKVAVALGVAAIPEGLPAVITLCLSLGTRRMAARRVIVRKLPSVETLGCTTVICSDKTGTLTTNQMVVASLVLPQRDGRAVHLREYEVEGVSYEPRGQVRGLTKATLGGGGVRRLAECAALCNDAELSHDSASGQYTRVGEPTEAALKVLVEKLGVPDAPPPPDAAAAADHYGKLRCSSWEKLVTLEFSRTRKSMSALCKPVGRGGSNVLFVKGAPESVLPRCSHLQLADGAVVRMNEAWARRIRETFTEMARRPLRCLALATKERGLGALAKWDGVAADGKCPAAINNPSKFVDVERGLTFTGLVGIKDPARPEVAASIRRCRDAGIRVVMITGDSAPTAAAIAKDVNIFDEKDGADGDGRVFVGGQFFELPKAKQEELLKTSNLVFCRAEPQDKQRLLKQLQTLGEVAAMTGDGVNDAPALQQASIGVAMGIAGTEVAKQAADMVLADDNFATIVAAVEEGRAIYANMKSFINFLITCNIGEVAAVFLATLLGLPEVLGPLHLLWVNLVTDGPPATALGFNPADPRSMRRPPRGRDDPLVSRFTLIRYIITGGYVGVATVGAFIATYQSMGIPLKLLRTWGQCSNWGSDAVAGFSNACDAFDAGKGKLVASAVALTTLVVMEMLRALCAVSETSSLLQKPPWANPWLLLGITFPMLLHLAVLYEPRLAAIFQLAPLAKDHWRTVAYFSAPLVLLEEMLKLWARCLGNEG